MAAVVKHCKGMVTRVEALEMVSKSVILFGDGDAGEPVSSVYPDHGRHCKGESC